MKKFGKVLTFYAVILLIAAPAFSQTPDLPKFDLDELNSTVKDFSKSLANSLPFNSTMGLNWSDAYIGQLLDMPPHFGIGITSGFTTMDFGSLNKLLNMFDTPLPDGVNIGGFPLPGYTIDARIGGFVLPFDIGFKLGILNLNPDFLNSLIDTGIPDFSMNYLLVGGDFRYALVEGKTIPFKVSVGAGFNYLKGGISLPVSGIESLSFKINNSRILQIPAPELGLNWETKSLDFKAQASIKVLILTPYIGFGVSHAWSKAGYGIASDIKVTDENGVPVPLDNETKKLIENSGVSGVSADGFSQDNEKNGWSFRTFGGFSINIPFVKFDFTGMYDFISGCYGITFGTRFQL
jgi:hypothetical protein